MVTLYRFYDVNDRLLYVGITRTGIQRIHGHASKAHWWSQVARASFEHDQTLEDEMTAIELERPLFNVDGTDRSDWIDTVNEATANGWLTDRAVIRRKFDQLIAMRDRLHRQLTEIETRLDLLQEASRTNRRVLSLPGEDLAP